LKTNVSIYIEDTDKAGIFNVKARGAMQVAVLVETMRREGFELLVSRPTVIEKVVALQDHLGWLHDADVAAGLARAFLVEHAGDLTELESAAIGRYLVDRERSLAKLRRTVSTPWRGVSSLAYRRAVGRLVAGL
jgi:hypothetical protein